MATDLEVFPISLPGGINQSAPVPDESDMEELENFGIFRGRLGLRAPLVLIATLQDDQGSPADVEAVLDIVEHEGKLWTASWSSVTDKVYLHSMQVDGSSLALVAVVWTGVTSRPTITLVSMQGGTIASPQSRLYAVDYNQNLDTKYWNGATVSTLTNDFDASGAAENVQFSLMIPHKFHMWGTGFYEGTVERAELARFSQPGLIPTTDPAGGTNPREWWTADHRSVGRRGDKIVAVASVGDRLLLFQKRAIHAIYGSGADTWSRQELSSVVGTVGPFAVVTVDRKVAYFWASDGPYRTDGVTLEYIGEPIRQLVVESDAAEVDTKVGYSSDDGLVHFVVSRGGQDKYTLDLVYDTRNERWFTETWHAGVEYLERIQNGGFASADNWDLSVASPPNLTNASVSGGKLHQDPVEPFPAAAYAIQVLPEENEPRLGEVYRVTLTITDLTTGDLHVNIAGFNSVNLSTNATHVVEIPITVEFGRQFLLSMYNGFDGKVDDVKCELISPLELQFGAMNSLDAASAPAPAGAPSTLVAAAVSDTQINLTWVNGDTNVDTETHIYRNTTTGFTTNDSTNRIVTVSSGVASYADTDTTLSSATTYYYKVRHQRNAQHSSESNEETETTWLNEPTVALAGLTNGLRITGGNLASVQDADVEIQYSTDGTTFAALTTLSDPGSSYSYDHTSLACGAWYYYRARAVAVGFTTSEWSTVASRQACNATEAPTAPSSFSATSGGQTEIDLAWTDNATNEDAFEIDRSTDGGSSYSLLATVSPDTVAYTDTGLTSATQYFYRVRAVNVVGQSAYATADDATTDPDIDAPTSLATSGATISSLTLSWVDNAVDETGFEIHQSDVGSGGPFTLAQTVGANSTGATRTGLSATTQYWFKVRAIRGATTGSFSSVATGTTLGTPPSPPSNLVATLGTPDSSVIDLAWDDNASDEAEFEVHRDSGGGFVEVASVGANVEAYQNTGLNAGTTYTYKVRACNVNGCSAFSNTDDATTSGAAAAPTAPSNLVATPDNADLAGVEVAAVDLSWDDNSTNEDSFVVEHCFGASCSSWSVLATLPAGTESFRDSGITDHPTDNTIKRYRVKAVNGAGSSAYVTSGDVTIEPQVTPSNVVAIDDSFCTGVTPTPQITLSWSVGDTTDLDQRRVERTGGPGGSGWTVVGSGVATEFSDTSVQFGFVYSYRVVDDHGSSGENTGVFTSSPSNDIQPVTPDCGED